MTRESEVRWEAVVIGTGFGGAISACRLSKQWPGKVLVLERGKRYPLGSFPRTPRDMARNFWNMPDEKHRRPKHVSKEEMRGLFDIRNYKHLDVVQCAGLGGGSLIYANVFLEPPDHIFDERWPQSCKKSELAPYYSVAKEVLGSRPIPQNNDPRRKIVRTELFEQFAKEVGRKSELVDLNVFFGNDFQNPLPIGEQDRNRYGALQTSCTYCAECDVGCNTQSKNTLDLNYLHVAEHRYQAQILTEHLAQKIVPLGAPQPNGQQQDDPQADGSHGYAVYYTNLVDKSVVKVVTNRVVVSAGTLNTTELLLRCRDEFRTLPRISAKLGHSYSGNGDFLSFVAGTNRPANPNYGPVITQRVDYNLFKDFDPQRAFILEDASYPNFAAWFVEGAKPLSFRISAMIQLMKDWFHRLFTGQSMGSVGWALSDVLADDLSMNTAVLLCMGIDKSNGVMSLDEANAVSVDWPTGDSRSLYDAILNAGQKFKEVFHAQAFFPIPTWGLWPWTCHSWPWSATRKNVSVHSLGGCILADSPEKGVTNSDRREFGQVFGYRNLFVADGALLPTAVGANPTATISAVSEMVAEGITHQKPDANL